MCATGYHWAMSSIARAAQQFWCSFDVPDNPKPILSKAIAISNAAMLVWAAGLTAVLSRDTARWNAGAEVSIVLNVGRVMGIGCLAKMCHFLHIAKQQRPQLRENEGG